MQITPISVIVRSILNNIINSNFSSEMIEQYVITNFASSQSPTKRGTSGGGAILVCACDQPYDDKYNDDFGSDVFNQLWDKVTNL